MPTQNHFVQFYSVLPTYLFNHFVVGIDYVRLMLISLIAHRFRIIGIFNVIDEITERVDIVVYCMFEVD